jgi:outer membrane receptor protein involved in Fe transport
MKGKSRSLHRKNLFRRKALALAIGAVTFSLANTGWSQATSGTVSATAQDAPQTTPQTTTQDTTKTKAKAATDSSHSQTLEKVTVTGSRIKRAEIEGPSPVVIITAEDIKKEGFTTVAEALGTLTQYTGAVVGGEWNFGNQQPDAQYLNLRGLGVGYQLILLNGKRMADYPAASTAGDMGISVGNIPAAAVDRIEVLSSSASAIYGSDAVAGVVNVITKENWQGNHVRLREGGATLGGGGTFDFQFSGGKVWDRGSITYGLEQLNRNPVYAWQRRDQGFYNPRTAPQQNPDPNHPTYTPTRGLAFWTYSTPGGYMHYNYWLDQAGNLVRASPASPDAGGALEYSCAQAGHAPYYPYKADGNTPSNCGALNYYDWVTLSNTYNKTSAFVSGKYHITDTVDVYGQLLVTRARDVMTQRSNLFMFNEGDAFDKTLGQFEYQRVLDATQIGGLSPRTYEDTAINANVGVKGKLFDRFDWDASLTFSQDKMHSWWRGPLVNKVNDYFFGPAVGHNADDGNAPIYDLGSLQFQHMFAPMSPADYASATDILNNHNTSQAASGQLVVGGPLFTLPAGEVEMSAVLEAEHSKYFLGPDIRSRNYYDGPDQTFNYHATWGGGSRNRYAAGMEFRVPIVSTLTASLATRYDKYDDISQIGGDTTWAAGLEWRPLESLLLRANRQTSFLAPNLMWIYGGPVSSYGTFTNEYLCRKAGLNLTNKDDNQQCYAGAYDDGLWYISGGENTHLKAENAVSNGVGFVWDVAEKLSVSLDYWDIELKNKSVYLATGDILDVSTACLLGSYSNGMQIDPNSAQCKLYESFVTRDAAGHITGMNVQAINQSGVKTHGFDASLRYAWSWGRLGDFTTNIGFTRVMAYQVQVAAGDVWQDAMHWTSDVAFRMRTNWTLGWSKDGWNVYLYGFRNSSRPNFNATRVPAVTGTIYPLRPFVQWNASVSKELAPGWRLGLDVVNVLNNFGPKDPTYTSPPYYNAIYGMMGRSIYANLDIDL